MNRIQFCMHLYQSKILQGLISVLVRGHLCIASGTKCTHTYCRDYKPKMYLLNPKYTSQTPNLPPKPKIYLQSLKYNFKNPKHTFQTQNLPSKPKIYLQKPKTYLPNHKCTFKNPGLVLFHNQYKNVLTSKRIMMIAC